MTTVRVPRPLLLLLLVLAALLTPAAVASQSAASAAGVSTARPAAVSVAKPARPTSGRADHRSQHQVLTTAAAKTAPPLHIATTPERRHAGPRLLLVLRPRPPNPSYAGSVVEAPTGRSPPSPAGT